MNLRGTWKVHAFEQRWKLNEIHSNLNQIHSDLHSFFRFEMLHISILLKVKQSSEMLHACQLEQCSNSQKACIIYENIQILPEMHRSYTCTDRDVLFCPPTREVHPLEVVGVVVVGNSREKGMQPWLSQNQPRSQNQTGAPYTLRELWALLW